MQTCILEVYGSNLGWSIDYPERYFEIFLGLYRQIPRQCADVLSFCVVGAVYLVECTPILIKDTALIQVMPKWYVIPRERAQTHVYRFMVANGYVPLRG